VDEGADMLMVKPGLPYLDVVRKTKDKVEILTINCPFDIKLLIVMPFSVKCSDRSHVSLIFIVCLCSFRIYR
jgi:hypothetical protein